MILRRWAAALSLPLFLALPLALFTGCAVLTSPPATPVGASPAEPAPKPAAPRQDTAQAAPSPTLGVTVEVDAPGELKSLLETHLDLVRLGRIAREDVDETEWSRLVDATPGQVRELLQTEGYFAPQVSVEREPGRASNQPDRVKLKVDPGPHARISRVTIEVVGDLERGASAGERYAARTLELLRSNWLLPAGHEFRNAEWSNAKAAALARLRAAGYATATWSGTGAEVDGERNEVRLFVVADSGPLFRYGELQVEGLSAHDAETVRNLANARAGAPVTESLLLDFQERLQKSNLFESISVSLDTDPEQAEQARIVARLREAPLQVYTFGAGISANTGLRASVEHTWRRAFGWPALMRNKIEWGQKRQYWDGELSSHPGPRLWRNLLGVTIENLISDDDTVLSQRVRLGRARETQRQDQFYFVEAERSRRVTEADEHTEAFALSVNYQSTWRRVDSVILPTRGYTFSGQGGIGRSHGTDAAAGIYQRAYGRLTVYAPLPGGWFGQARVEGGRVFLRQNMVVPDSQKWRAGGDESVRGYAYRSLGPLVDGAVDGGTNLLTGSLEVARPIVKSLPSVWGALFIDAGNAANSLRELHPVVGYGAGVRWRSPVGPLRIDYAWGRATHRGRLHFSVGIAF